MGRIIIMEGLWEMLSGINVGRKVARHVLQDTTWGCDRVKGECDSVKGECGRS